MPYLSVSDFKYGMDRRRPRVAGLPGTLWTLKNAVITRGGDIERVKKWVPEYDLPAGSLGFASLKGLPYVFGKAASLALMPPEVSYQQIAYGGAATLLAVHDAKPFNGKMYVISEWSDGHIRHSYNTTVITTEWDTQADAKFTYSTVAQALAKKINARTDVSAFAIENRVKISATTPGTGFTIATAVTDNGGGSTPSCVGSTVQANVAAVAEVRAAGTVTITGGSSSPSVNKVTQIAVDGNDLLAAPVNWVGSNSATAAAVAAAINARAEAGYTASAIGADITIQAAPGTGAAVNGEAFTVTVDGDVTATSVALSGGVTEVEAVRQISQVTVSAASSDALDLWQITINGTAYQITGRGSAMPLFIHVTKRRMWAPIGSALYYCKLGDPTIWTTTSSPALDPGFIEMSSDSEGSDDLTSLADYNADTAIFSGTNIRIYSLNTDPSLISIVQTLGETGSQSAHATKSFGSTDVFYLDASGARSLRSRQGYDAAFATDIGSPIDPYLHALMEEVGDAVTAAARAVIEAHDGRYFLFIGDQQIILSFFPGPGITAWSTVDLEFTPDQVIRVGHDIMARAGDTIYVYGGEGGDVYPDAGEYAIDAQTPFHSAQDPGNRKGLKGFDMAGDGVFHVEVLVDPNDETKVVDIGYVSEITYSKDAIVLPGNTSHVAFRFRSASAGRATLSSFAIHYHKGETG